MSDETKNRWTIYKTRHHGSGVSGPETSDDSTLGARPVRSARVEVMSVAEHEVEVEVAGADVARAARQLWEAAVEHFYDVDDKGDPIPLAVSLYDNPTAYDGMPIKGQDLYWIGVALGFIGEEKSDD